MDRLLLGFLIVVTFFAAFQVIALYQLQEKVDQLEQSKCECHLEDASYSLIRGNK